jgi:hypothetical protein
MRGRSKPSTMFQLTCAKIVIITFISILALLLYNTFTLQIKQPELHGDPEIINYSFNENEAINVKTLKYSIY